MAKKTHHVIIGSGAAGSYCALKLRELDRTSSITLISREPYHFYHKFALPDYISGKIRKEILFEDKVNTFIDAGITLRLSQEVTRIDTDNKAIYLAHREKTSYDKLLIATGVHSFVPAAYKHFAPMFSFLNNLEDAESLSAEAKKLKSTLIIGGGLTSIKLALALTAAGNSVDYLLYKRKTIKLLADEAAMAIIEELLSKEQVIIIEDTDIKYIEETGKGYFVTFSSGKKQSYTAIVAGFGVQPNIKLAHKAGIDCDFGVLVNEYFETSKKDVYAAGDSAQIYNPTIRDYWVNFGWPNAVAQGKLAARNMCGKKTAYDTNRVNVLDIKGTKINFRNWE